MDSTGTIVSESEVSLIELERQASTLEEIIFEGVPENINSWNSLSEASHVSEFLPSTFETITEAADSLVIMKDIQKQLARTLSLWQQLLQRFLSKN